MISKVKQPRRHIDSYGVCLYNKIWEAKIDTGEIDEFFLLAGEIDESIIMDGDLDMSSIRNEHIQQAGGHS